MSSRVLQPAARRPVRHTLAVTALALAAAMCRPAPTLAAGSEAVLKTLPTPAELQAEPSAAASTPGPPLERLTLSQALERAAAHNATIATAQAQIRRADGIVAQVRAGALPTLTASGLYTRLDDDRRLGDQVFVPADQINANLTLTVPLLAAQRWVQWQQARTDRTLALQDVEVARRQVEVSTAHAYLAVLAAQRVIDSNQRARALALAHYAFAHTRLSGGLGSELDAVRALQTLREDTARVEAARAALAQAQGALGAMLGLDRSVDASETPELRLDGLDGGASAVPPRSEREPAQPSSFLSLLPERRADLLALSARKRAARQVLHDGWADYMPTLLGVFMPLYQHPPNLVQPSFSWQLQLQLSVPFYDGGLRYGSARVRAAEVDIATAQADGALSQARTALAAGLAALRHRQQAVAEAAQAAQLAHRAVEIAELSYRLGATTNLELLDAQRRARDADTAVVLAEDDLRRVRLDILAAAGLFPPRS